MSLPTLEAIAAALAQYQGPDTVSFEYPGCVHVLTDDALWVVGRANGPLGADYYEYADNFADGDTPNRSIEIVVADDASADDAAAAVYAALTIGVL